MAKFIQFFQFSVYYEDMVCFPFVHLPCTTAIETYEKNLLT